MEFKCHKFENEFMKKGPKLESKELPEQTNAISKYASQ